MDKKSFLQVLRKKLSKFPKKEVDEVIDYYDNLIEDKKSVEHIEEESAVKSFGTADEVAKKCAMEMLTDCKQKNPFKAAAIALGVMSTPILIPLVIVIAVVYLVIFCVWIALTVAFGASAIATLCGAVVIWFTGYPIYPKLAACGGCLIAFAIMGLLTYFTALLGGKLINLCTAKLIKKLTKKNKKEEIK